jgi:cytochrome oxidase Cu insertion factor (SCO1/SenC/PrrC family)
MSDPADGRRRASARRTLVLLALVCAAPVVASYVAYYWLRPAAHVNYGELLEAKPAPEIAGVGDDGAPWRLSSVRGRWVLLVAGDAACDARCEGALYATRQARTIQNREQERIVRVLLQPTGAPPLDAPRLAQHPGLVIVRASPAQRSLLPGSSDATSIYLVDPLGNLVLRYPADPDIKRLAKDLERLLRASRIG